MKTYIGSKKSTCGGQSVAVAENLPSKDGFLRMRHYALPHIVRHSPTGLQWGYGGSGPADLALSILTDCLGKRMASRYYQQFKFDVVSFLPDEFMITEEEIKGWLKVITDAENKTN